MAHKHFKIALFSSGSGSNAEKIIEYFKNHPSISVEILYANNKNEELLKLFIATNSILRQCKGAILYGQYACWKNGSYIPVNPPKRLC